MPYEFVDADWDGGQEKRMSMIEYIVIMEGATVTWYAHRKEVIIVSSTEDEYMAMWVGAKEVFWIGNLALGLRAEWNADDATIVLVEYSKSLSRCVHRGKFYLFADASRSLTSSRTCRVVLRDCRLRP